MTKEPKDPNEEEGIEISEEDMMREAYDEDDPKHPDFMERLVARADYFEDR